MPKRTNQRFKRNIFSVLLIVVICAAVYQYFQQPQQETVNILKRYGVYDQKYNYVMFGTLDVDSVLSQANRSESTLSYGYSVQNYTGVYSYTYTNYHTNTTGEFTYGPWSATSYGFYSSNYYSYPLGYSFVNVTYSLQGSSEGGVDFSYQNGPICNWDQTTNGQFAWSGCTSFVLLIFTNRHPLNYSTELQNRTLTTNSLTESYGVIVVGNYGSFYYAAFRWKGTDWRFYLFYATLSP
jgi:hypothetical protein